MHDFIQGCTVNWILFDFGGVLSEEGFAQGLREIGRQNGLDPELVLKKGQEHVYVSGYLLGQNTETEFWARMRNDPGISGRDTELRAEILNRFQPREWMLDLVQAIKASGTQVAILSDQVDWLDLLNTQYGFFNIFDQVFNSYHTGLSKSDPATFKLVLQKLQCSPDQALFIDDDPGHILRAKQQGLHSILYRDRQDFLQRLQEFCPAAGI